MPRVWQALLDHSVPVVYARTVSGSRDPAHWKVRVTSTRALVL